MLFETRDYAERIPIKIDFSLSQEEPYFFVLGTIWCFFICGRVAGKHQVTLLVIS